MNNKLDILLSLLDTIESNETNEENRAKVKELRKLIVLEYNTHKKIQELFDELMEV